MNNCEKCGAPTSNRVFCSHYCQRHATKNKKHGKSASAEHGVWRVMRDRCRNPKNKDYPRYGGRGISVCERWDSFECFIADMGPKPGPTYSIERVNNNGDYEPSNCKWGSKAEQSRNRRCALPPEKVQQIKSAPPSVPGYKLAEQIGCSASVVYRIRRGASYSEDLR